MVLRVPVKLPLVHNIVTMVMVGGSFMLVAFILLTFNVVTVVDPAVESFDVTALVGEKVSLQEASLGENLVTTRAL